MKGREPQSLFHPGKVGNPIGPLPCLLVNVTQIRSSPLDEEARGTFAVHRGVQLVLALASHCLKRTLNKPITKDRSYANMRLHVQLEWYVLPCLMLFLVANMNACP